jgi:hypothetical protein
MHIVLAWTSCFMSNQSSSRPTHLSLPLVSSLLLCRIKAGKTREEKRKENVGLYRSFGFCVGLHAEAWNDLFLGRREYIFRNQKHLLLHSARPPRRRLVPSGSLCAHRTTTSYPHWSVEKQSSTSSPGTARTDRQTDGFTGDVGTGERDHEDAH